jgi:acylphosphatase
MQKHVSIKVSGRVQGVFFRASTKKKADEVDIKGYVRNEPDGSVYIEAAGEEANLKTFIDWCHQGPPNARVTGCEIKEAAIHNFNNFKIQR